jgi:competence protein ComEC
MPLKVHFLNVGHGDCTIIEFPSGNIGMVDIDNLKVLDPDTRSEMLEEYRESLDYQLAIRRGNYAETLEERFVKSMEENLTDPLAYYDAHIGPARSIFRLLITHPDMDHMTGIHRFHEQDSRKDIINFWHTGTDEFNLADARKPGWDGFRYDKRDWDTYRSLRSSKSAPKALVNHQGAQGDFWSSDGIELWSPTPQLVKTAVEKDQANILSMVLKITYKGRSILLGGDATATETWPAIYPEIDMKGIDVLKASHHGRKTGYYQPAVKKMSPWLTITSVGEKEHDATDSYRRYSEYTVSLRKAGDVRITIDDNGKLLYSPNVEDHWKTKLND